MQKVSSSTVTMKMRRPSHSVGTKVTGDKVGSLVGTGVVITSNGAGVGFSVGSTVTMMGTGYGGQEELLE